MLKSVDANVTGFSRKAMSTLKSVVDRYPDEFGIWNDLGVKCLLASQQDEARKAFTEVSFQLLLFPSFYFAPSRGLDFCDDRVCLCVCLQIYLQTYTWGANFCELKNLVVDAVPDLPVAVVTFDGDTWAHHKVWGLCGCSAALYQAALAICYDSCDLILPMIKLAWWCNDRMSEVTSLIFS